jgi:hypothetical protein
MLKLDAPFSLRMVQLEHGDTQNKDHDSGDELEYSCALKLKNKSHWCGPCGGELTLPEVFGFFIEVRSFGEPDNNKHGTNRNSNEEANRRAKKNLKCRVSDMRYFAGAVCGIPGSAFCEGAFASVGARLRQRPLATR